MYPEAVCSLIVISAGTVNKGNTKELSKAEDEEFLKCLKALADLKEPEWKRVFSSKVFEKKMNITPSKVFERSLSRCSYRSFEILAAI